MSSDPIEKAKELIDKFKNLGLSDLEIIKASVVFLIDEVIDSWLEDGNPRFDKGVINFWEKVKLEVIKYKN